MLFSFGAVFSHLVGALWISTWDVISPTNLSVQMHKWNNTLTFWKSSYRLRYEGIFAGLSGHRRPSCSQQCRQPSPPSGQGGPHQSGGYYSHQYHAWPGFHRLFLEKKTKLLDLVSVSILEIQVESLIAKSWQRKQKLRWDLIFRDNESLCTGTPPTLSFQLSVKLILEEEVASEGSAWIYICFWVFQRTMP